MAGTVMQQRYLCLPLPARQLHPGSFGGTLADAGSTGLAHARSTGIRLGSDHTIDRLAVVVLGLDHGLLRATQTSAHGEVTQIIFTDGTASV